MSFLAREQLDRLFELLHADGRQVVGPTVRDGAIVHDEVRSVADLPAGYRDEQAPGRYRLAHDPASPRLFDFSVGPTGPKSVMFPAEVPLAHADRDGEQVSFRPATSTAPRVAQLGVRACEIAAMEVQDRVLAGGPFVDPDYRARRSAGTTIAVQCTRAGATCFCGSMGTGPELRSGYDLALTELDDGYLVDAGTPYGSELLAGLPTVPARDDQLDGAAKAVAATRVATSGAVQTEGLRDRLLDQLDSPRWAEIAERCLACTNCTMVCPTCFCTSVNTRSDLDGVTNTLERRWDSCFTEGFAKVAGGNFRPRRQDRYRQWLTHKFATWVDQFGEFGCVGCGRCVTWCPVGIDVREELRAVAPAYQPDPSMPVLTAAGRPDSYVPATVRSVTSETHDTSTLRLDPDDARLLTVAPGQFVMVQQPGFPPLPISVSRVADGELWLTIRAAGPATTVAIGLTPGRQLGLRGPLGRGWPVERALGRDVVIVAGGIGLAPLRPLIDAIRADRTRFGDVLIAYGARTPQDRLFPAELDAWRAEGLEVLETVDRADPAWLGPVGVVTHLLDRREWRGRPGTAYVCGPERMMQATVQTLADRGIPAERTFVSMERHMECGIGLCGHCQMGKYFVCKDGPVFAIPELGDLFGREGV